MLPFRVCLVSLLLTICSVSGGTIVFEDTPSADSEQNPTNTEGTSNVGTRNGPFSDSISVEAAGTSPSGEPDGRFFGLFSGGGGLLGGLGQYGAGGGYPAGGPYGAGLGGTKPGRCPGIMGLGIGQPEGGYGYAPHGVGHYNGYGQYGHGIYGQGQYGQGQFGQGQYGHGYGGAPFGHGLHHPAAGYAPLGGYGSGFGFRSGDQTNDADAQKKEGSRRRRSDDATVSEAAKESTNGDSAAQGRALANDHQTDPRLLGLFGKSCFNDFHCPGQLKCCAGVLGKHATCQQPALFG